MSTLGTEALRRKYFSSSLQTQLRNAVVAEEVCQVDRSDLNYIASPYVTAQSATVQAKAGTYTPAAMTVTNDTLTVTDEVWTSTHVFDFETLTANFNLTADFLEDLAAQVLIGVDKFVLNNLCEDGTGAYTTPAGGFTTSANIPVIMANLLSKVAGYQGIGMGRGSNYFLVIENTDLVGFMQTQVSSGYAYADAALNYGFMPNYMGVDVYVVRSGTFVNATIGSTTVTNSGHRVFGVKGVATYASPRGMRYEEKSVTGKTGKEIVAFCLVGFKLWTPKTDLIIDITLA